MLLSEKEFILLQSTIILQKETLIEMGQIYNFLGFHQVILIMIKMMLKEKKIIIVILLMQQIVSLALIILRDNMKYS